MTTPQQPQQPQQPTQPGMRPMPAQRQPKGTTVCGIIGLVLGVLALILSFIPIVNNAAAVLGAIGVVLGVIGVVGTFRGRKSGKAIAVVATVLSVLGIVITLSMQASFSKAIDDATASAAPSASATKDGGEDGSTPAAQDQEGDLDDMHVRIVSAVKSTNDYEGAPTVLVTYEWTNRTDRNTSFMAAANAQAFQNGRQLDVAVYADAPEGYDATSSMKDLQPGASGTVTIGYVLKDDSPVTVEVTDLFSLDDERKVAHTFQLA